MHQDAYRERSLIRLALHGKDYQEQCRQVVHMIYKATLLPQRALSCDRAQFFEEVQEDLWETQTSEKEGEIIVKRQFKKEWSFADVDLTHEQREDFEVWCNKPDLEIYEVLPIVLSQGYKISIVFKPERDAWIATLTGMDGAPFNTNVSMSSFHQTVDQAIALALYKHLVVAEEREWASIAKPRAWG